MTNDPETCSQRASDEEALRLVLAFYCILEPDKRNEVLALAERYAATAKVIDGLTQRRTALPQDR
jgi:hypothetical protein